MPKLLNKCFPKLPGTSNKPSGGSTIKLDDEQTRTEGEISIELLFSCLLIRFVQRTETGTKQNLCRFQTSAEDFPFQTRNNYRLSQHVAYQVNSASNCRGNYARSIDHIDLSSSAYESCIGIFLAFSQQTANVWEGKQIWTPNKSRRLEILTGVST